MTKHIQAQIQIADFQNKYDEQGRTKSFQDQFKAERKVARSKYELSVRIGSLLYNE
jgi:hypothetical protein